MYCDGLDGGNFVYEAFDDLDDFLNRNHPDTLKTLKEHGIDVERDGHKCLVILRHAAEDGPKNAIIRINVQDNVDVPESSRLSRDVRALATLEPAEKLNELRRALDVKAVPRDAVKGAKDQLLKIEAGARIQKVFRSKSRLTRKELASAKQRLRRVGDEGPVALKGRSACKYDVFLSHQWRHGQDVMRIIKLRLKEMVGDDFRVFLDVDNLKSGRGLEYVDQSYDFVAFIVEGYFTSPNCVREALRAIHQKKKMVALVDPESSKGGLSRDEIRKGIESACDNLEKWGLADELAKWKPPMTPPSADEFYEMFLGEGTEPIEWARIAPFQDLCIRLLAETGLDDTQKPTMVQSEITSRLPELPQPRRGGFHVFVSKHNPNGAYVMEEVKRALTEEKGTLLTTDDAERMRECECFLVYLTALTWTSGEASDAFAKEVQTAMQIGCSLLLVHEMPSAIHGDDGHHPIDFDKLFPGKSSPTTPKDLVDNGIYESIAVPLRGARFRECSIAMLAQEIADKNAPDMDDMPDVATSEVPPSDTAPAIGAKRWSTAMWMLSPNYDATRRMVASS